jgi:hypothetical protein
MSWFSNEDLLARDQVYRSMFAATIDFDFKLEPVAFVEAGHASAFDSGDMHESIGLSVVALDEAEAFHRVEELHRAAGFFAGQRPLWRTTETAAAFARAIAVPRRATIRDRHRFAIDLEISGRNLAATINKREAKRLPFGQTGQARLLDGRNMNEHIFAAIITNDKAEALLSVEKLDHARAFANDLCGHATTGTTTAAGETATAATAAAETTAATATAAESVTAAAEAIATTAATEAITAAGKAAAITTAAAAIIAETVALIASASAAITAATFIKTHAVPVLSSKSPACSFKKHLAPDAGKMLPGAIS